MDALGHCMHTLCRTHGTAITLVRQERMGQTPWHKKRKLHPGEALFWDFERQIVTQISTWFLFMRFLFCGDVPSVCMYKKDAGGPGYDVNNDVYYFSWRETTARRGEGEMELSYEGVEMHDNGGTHGHSLH